jgi:hypothetical protein
LIEIEALRGAGHPYHVGGGAKPSRAATPSSGAGIISANILLWQCC